MERAEGLDILDLYQNGAICFRKDLKELFASATSFILEVNNNEKVHLTREMEYLLAMIPTDYVVGSRRGVKLHPADFMGVFAKKGVYHIIHEELYYGISEPEVRALGQKVQAYIDHTIPKGSLRNQTLREVNSAWVSSLRSRMNDERMFQAGIEAFPDDWPAEDETKRTFRALRTKAEQARLEIEAMSLLEAARSAVTGTNDQARKLNALIQFAYDHPEFDMNRDGACFRNSD